MELEKAPTSTDLGVIPPALFIEMATEEQYSPHFSVGIQNISKTQKEIPLIKTLNEISWEFKNSNIDSAFYYARKSLKVSKDLNDEQAIASSYNSLANCFDAMGILDSALTYHKKSLDIKIKIGQNIGVADSYNNIGIVYAGEKQHYTAIEYFESALNKKKNDIDSLCNLGNSLLEIEKFRLSYECFKQAVKHDPNDFDAIFRLGITCNNLKKPEEALMYFNKILRKEKDNTDAIINKGYSLHLMKKYKQAILCLTTSSQTKCFFTLDRDADFISFSSAEGSVMASIIAS